MNSLKILSFLRRSVAPESKQDGGRRDPLSLALALLILLLGFVDGVFTAQVVRAGMYKEVNPLWADLIPQLGITFFLGVKMGVTALMVMIVLSAKRAFSRGALLFLFGFYLSLVLTQLALLNLFPR